MSNTAGVVDNVTALLDIISNTASVAASKALNNATGFSDGVELIGSSLNIVEIPEIPTVVVTELAPSLTTPPVFPAFPTLPVSVKAPTEVFEYIERPYDSNIDDTLKTDLENRIKKGNQGLGEAAEKALVDKEKERLLLEFYNALDLEADLAAESGFPLAPGSMANSIIALESKMMDDKLQLNRTTAVEQLNLAQDQNIESVKAANTYIQQDRAYESSVRQRLLGAAKVAPSIAIDLYRSKINEIDVLTAQYNAVASRYNALAGLYDAMVLEYTASIDTQEKIMDAQARTYALSIEAENKKLNATNSLGESKAAMVSNIKNLLIECLRAAAHVKAQIAAAALTAINASAHASAEGVFGNNSDYSMAYESLYRVNETT